MSYLLSSIALLVLGGCTTRDADHCERSVRNHRRHLRARVDGALHPCPLALGFIALFSVAVLNGIVLVSFMNEQLMPPLRCQAMSPHIAFSTTSCDQASLTRI